MRRQSGHFTHTAYESKQSVNKEIDLSNSVKHQLFREKEEQEKVLVAFRSINTIKCRIVTLCGIKYVE